MARRYDALFTLTRRRSARRWSPQNRLVIFSPRNSIVYYVETRINRTDVHTGGRWGRDFSPKK